MPVLPRFLPFAVLLAAGPSFAAAPKKAAPGEAVTLRFAWPEGLQAQVRDTLSSNMVGEEGAPDVTVTQRYPLKGEVRGQERWLVPGPVEATPAEIRVEVSASNLDTLVAK